MILCVDADDAAREATAETLAEAGYDTVECGSRAEAGDALAGEEPVDCLVTEFQLDGGTGFDVVRDTREHHPDAACVLFTETPAAEVDTATVGDLVVEYLRKGDPDAHERLVSLVDHAVSFRSQTAYPLPEDEEARVAALERYAADPEALGESLDRLTELATALFDLSAAAVGLVDAREERFLSCHGASLASSTARRRSAPTRSSRTT